MLVGVSKVETLRLDGTSAEHVHFPRRLSARAHPARGGVGGGRAGASALPQKPDGDKRRDQTDLQFHRKKTHLQRSSRLQR